MDLLQINRPTPALPDLSHKLDNYQAPVVQTVPASTGSKVDFNAIIGLLGTFLGSGGSASNGATAGSTGSNLDVNAIILADAQQSASNRRMAYLLVGSLLVVFVIIAVVFLKKSS